MDQKIPEKQEPARPAVKLQLEQIEKTFFDKEGRALPVLKKVSVRAEEGETAVILGPSGCGKTTLLNIAAGFEQPDGGRALLDGRPVSGPDPSRAVVFQSPTLFPWLTVEENVRYGLKRSRRKRKREEKRKNRPGGKTPETGAAGKGAAVEAVSDSERCREMIGRMGLSGFEGYYPDQLSGGMQQRTALARVLVMEPEVLLMDEPFAALDAQTRLSMQQLLKEISGKRSLTVLFITHDVEEALLLADRIYVMSRLPGVVRKTFLSGFREIDTASALKHPDFTARKSEILALLGES